MTVLYIVLAVLVLLLMVLVHEFGHYCIGRMLNFKITEFSIGFGKAIFSKKNKRGELISLRIFPLGGYCAFAGEDGNETENKKDCFTSQKPWKRILVFLAGITFNFAFAVITSAILLCTVGYDIPQIKKLELDTTKITGYVNDSLTYNYDSEDSFKVGDVVVSLNGKQIDFAYGEGYTNLITADFQGLKDYINAQRKIATESGVEFDERQAYLDYGSLSTSYAVVRRNGEYKEIKVGYAQVKVLQTAKDDNGNIIYEEDGETPKQEEVYVYCWPTTAGAYVHSFGEAVERAVPFSFGLAWSVLKSLWQLITLQIPITQIGGPITTIATIAQVTQSNFVNLLILIPLISANLAIFNLLPIPALDGAHVVFTTIEAIRKKPIKREVENMIHTIGLIILLGFVVLVDFLHFIL